VTGHRAIYVQGMVWLTLGANHGFEKAAAKQAAQNSQGSSGGKKEESGKKKKILGQGLLARAALKQQQAKAAELKRHERKMAQGCFYAVRKNYILHYKDAANSSGGDDKKKKTYMNRWPLVCTKKDKTPSFTQVLGRVQNRVNKVTTV
jgi:hypothetical protein